MRGDANVGISRSIDDYHRSSIRERTAGESGCRAIRARLDSAERQPCICRWRARVAPEDFSLEKHRRIFARMKDLYDRGEKIDRVTVANELMKQGQLESVDGLGYLVSLDEGLPEIANLDSYVRIVKDKATLRKLIFSAQAVIDRCLIGEEEPDEILASAEETLMKLGEARAREQLSSPAIGDRKIPGRRQRVSRSQPAHQRASARDSNGSMK